MADMAQPPSDPMLGQMKELVGSLHHLRCCAEETENKLNEETSAHARTQRELKSIGDRLNEELALHAETKRKIKVKESDYARAIEGQEIEHRSAKAKLVEVESAHDASKAKLGESERAQTSMRETLESTKSDLTRMKLANERLETEKETLRVMIYDKVMEYVARERKLMRGQYEALQGDYIQTKASLDALQEKHDGYDKKYEQMRFDYTELQNELVSQRETNAKTMAEQTPNKEEMERTIADLKITAETLRAAIHKSRKKTMEALEKQFLGSDSACQKMVLDEWSRRVYGSKDAKAVKEKNMRRTLQRISGSDEILKATCFSAWSGTMGGAAQDAELQELEKYKKIAKEQEALAMERAAASRQRAQAVLEKQFLEQDGAMKKKIIMCWTTFVEDVKLGKAEKDKAKTKTLRAIAGGSDALKTMCFQAWSSTRMSKERAMELRQIEEYKKQKEEQERLAKERADISKTRAREALLKQFMQQDAVLRRNVMESWRNLAAMANTKKMQKDRNMQRSLRNIIASEKVLLQRVFTAWEKSYSRDGLKKQVEQHAQILKERDDQLDVATKQLSHSAWVAKEIQGELTKAQTIVPRKFQRPRPSSRGGSRPSSRQGMDNGLPAITPRSSKP